MREINELSKFRNCNIVLPFFRWREVFERVQDIFEEVYVDFPYEEVSMHRCWICGAQCIEKNAHFAPFIVKRMFKGTNVETKLIKCLKCYTQFSSYRPNDTEMRNLYSGYRDEEYIRTRQETEEYSREIYYNDDVEIIRRRELEAFLGEDFEYDKIEYLLDYGGDEGQFIPMKFEKAEKFVYEISGNNTRPGIRILNEFEDIAKYRWDFIMCCHVLEHVADPMAILDYLFSIIGKGFFYLELPYENFMESYSNAEINEHINFFTLDSLRQIANRYHLKIKKIEQTSNVLKALYEMEN